MELQGRVDELRESGLGAVAISYDPVEVLSDFSDRRGITYPLLSDSDSATIEAFGILNTVANEGLGPNADDPAVRADVERYVSVFGAVPMIVGTPFPGTFIVDGAGKVTARFFEDFYRERTTAARIMLRLGVDTNPVAGVEGATAHLELRTYQSNAEVSAGTLFTLGLEIVPNPGIHLYAPGAEELGYRVIRLALEPSAHVRLAETEYPASEMYHFVPLDEHVPVYQKAFHLHRDVLLEASNEAEKALRDTGLLTLSGRLEYQACDDEKCFNPMSVPLSWTVAVAAHDSQRAKRER